MSDILTIWLVLLFLMVLGFELRVLNVLGRCSTTWATLSTLFCIGYFQHRVLQTICLGWLWVVILVICVSWVARFIGMSHQVPSGLVLILILIYNNREIQCYLVHECVSVFNWFRLLLLIFPTLAFSFFYLA
jgi:hypothetical protein